MTSTTKSVSARIITTILAAKNMEVITDEIGNAYFNVNTEENIYTHAGDDLKLVRIISEGNLLEVLQALSKLLTSGNR